MALTQPAGTVDLNITTTPSSSASNHQQGLTLTELVFAIALIAILAAVAVPSYQGFLAQQRIKTAANTLSQDLRFGREESVRLGRKVHVSFQSGAKWCWGLRFDQACDCSGANPAARCDISRAGVADFKGVALLNSQPAIFEPEQGRVAQLGHTEFVSQSGNKIRVELMPNGRVRSCAVGGELTGIDPC